MLSPDDLAAMRAQQEAAMPDTAAIYPVVQTSDSAGGFTEARGTMRASVVCRLAPTTGVAGRASTGRSERVRNGGLGLESWWWVTVPVGTVIARTDQVVISGRTFEVVDTGAGPSWETARRVLCVEVT